ncbi:hypothetical protein GobsT_12590 [Gemmata obscuriglobus]|uniref:hypothetical protein n=1 Tax=Gemmata obscuriglobus TaxID=114 RepID=UPI0011CD1C47|nr:hypothetical protein [Gemmata obscuriglobus]QEG26519.1 hypothetical protein GobsT_12590 [Gemmata obscuriglobus]VTS01844.1 unnamed protein product [Gemmata obscuriglobus UQM 2246]
MNEDVTDTTTTEVTATELAEMFLAHREKCGAKLTVAMRRCDPATKRFTQLIEVQEPGDVARYAPGAVMGDIRNFIRALPVDTCGEEDVVVESIHRCLLGLLWDSRKIAPEHNVQPLGGCAVNAASPPTAS